MKSKSYLPYLIAGATGAAVASLIPLFVSPSNADTKLLPFQGRLTDASGTAIPDGAKVVEFKMYDAPTGGNLKNWAGEVHKHSVNGGLVNTIPGSISHIVRSVLTAEHCDLLTSRDMLDHLLVSNSKTSVARSFHCCPDLSTPPTREDAFHDQGVRRETP